MSSEIISNLEILETSESKTFDEGFVSLQSPTPLEWVTLVFPNYSEKPVEQRWSKTTLSVIPYFAKLFSFPSPDSGRVRITLEWDPKIFVEIIDSIRCQEKTHIEAFSEFLGLEIRKGVPKKPKKKQIQIAKRFFVGSTTAVYRIDHLMFRTFKSLRWTSSEKLLGYARKFKVTYHGKEYSLNQQTKLLKALNDEKDEYGRMYTLRVHGSDDIHYPPENCAKSQVLELLLVVDYE